jgi:D-3-phosphoglycerate dehydrogenase / 2-oxoglutarate reductase
MRVLAAGDRFIGADLLADAAVAALGAGTEVVRYEASWPDEPFGPVDGVREAAGDPAEVARLAADVDVVLTHLAPITAAVLASPRLKVVGVTRGGPVNVDLAAATARGVPVVNLPGRNLGAVAEFTIGLMIALPRNVVRASRELASGAWDARYFRRELTGPELRACTVGLIGLGAVGLRVAELLRGFGARVLGYDPYVDDADGISLVSLPDLLGRSDIVSVHARLTDETRGMLGVAEFAAMKRGAYLVNTARGELVDQQALHAALDRGQLAGAALDVFDPEPPAADDPLLRRADVVATPHLAGASRQVAVESAERVAAEVARFIRTGEVAHCANPDWAGART